MVIGERYEIASENRWIRIVEDGRALFLRNGARNQRLVPKVVGNDDMVAERTAEPFHVNEEIVKDISSIGMKFSGKKFGDEIMNIEN